MIRLITPLLLMAALSLSFQSFAQQHRVKRIQREQHTFNLGVVKTDSAVLYFSGTNGGQITWQWAEQLSLGTLLLYSANPLIQYDSLIDKTFYNKHIQTYSYYDNGIYRAFQQFNSGGQLVDYKQYFTGTNASIQLQKSETYTYTGNLLTESKIDNALYKHYYNNGLLQKTEIRYNPMSSPWKIITYNYDVNGNLMRVVYPDKIWDTTFTDYTYDNQNRVISKRSWSHYSASAMIDTVSQYTYDYNNNDDIVKETRYFRPYVGANTLHLWAIFESSFDNQHRKLELIHYAPVPGNTQPEPFYKRVFTYDSNHLLTKLTNVGWNGTQWESMPDTTASTTSHTYTFDYEVAWPTGVPEVKDAAEVKLYPSPASDFIRVETEWKQAAPFTAAILDMQGRVMRQWDEPATKNYARTIPLTELPAGMYVIKLSCGEEQYSRRFSVYK